MEMFQSLAQYGALGLIVLASGVAAYYVAKAAWSIYVEQRDTIKAQHVEMVAMSEKHSAALDAVRVQTAEALNNNTSVMEKISDQMSKIENRLGVVEEDLRGKR